MTASGTQPKPSHSEVPYGSHLVRLSLVEWTVAAILILGITTLLPWTWSRW